MTEEEWLKGGKPRKMLRLIQDKISNRKLRLFAVACCRRIWHALEDDTSRRAVEIAEGFADGDFTAEELDSAWRNCWKTKPTAYVARSAATAASATCASYDSEEVYQWLPNQVHAEQYEEAMRVAEERAQQAAAWEAAQLVLKPAAEAAATDTERWSQAELLHDLVGNPFRPISFYPAWLKPNVIQLATAIYEERAFDRMPFLADALQDAGCSSSEILNHCRGTGVHVRGCCCLDFILGKE
jgi:hypothetical protein